MENLETENEQLKQQLAKAKLINSRLKLTIARLKENYIYDVASGIENAFLEYSNILNPQIVEVKASFNNRLEVFKINPIDVICIATDERVKKIILKKEIFNKKGKEERLTWF